MAHEILSHPSGGSLKYPHKPAREPTVIESEESRADEAVVLTGVKGKTHFAGTPRDAPRNPDGSFKNGWHWNMPYAVKRELPEWYKKEAGRK